MAGAAVRLVVWGTYDIQKPRVRLLLAGARDAGMIVTECHKNVWMSVEDKNSVRGRRLVAYLFRWLLSYPKLIFSYLRLPSHDLVLVPYMGQIDVLLLWPFARLRGKPIVWDMFLSLYDTAVNDRSQISRFSPVAFFLYALEWLACRAATAMFLDTEAHARYIEHLFRLPFHHVGRVIVGAEAAFFHRESSPLPRIKPKVLFYGQFIPLHGIQTIVEAAKCVEDRGESIEWVLVGQGQEQPRIDALIRSLSVQSIQRVAWARYEDLPHLIQDADICLGIFGVSDKAANVIPNKVFQVAAGGRPLITAGTPAVREWFSESAWVRFVPPGDAAALAEAVIVRAKQPKGRAAAAAPIPSPPIDFHEVGRQFADVVEKV